MQGGHNSAVIALGNVVLPSVDLAAAQRQWKCLPGRAVVEMCPQRLQSAGGIYLSDKAAGRWRANVGVMLSAGIDRKDKPSDPDKECTYKPGDAVVVRAYDGAWFTDEQYGDFRPQGVFNGSTWCPNEIRFYGMAFDMELQKDVVWDLYDQIVGWWDNGTFVPGPGNLLVKRDRRAYAIETNLKTWLDTGIVLDGDKSMGAIAFKETHPDDLLHIQWTEEDDLWIVPTRCVELK